MLVCLLLQIYAGISESEGLNSKFQRRKQLLDMENRPTAPFIILR